MHEPPWLASGRSLCSVWHPREQQQTKGETLEKKGISNLIARGFPNESFHLVAKLKSIAGDELLANVEDLEFRARLFALSMRRE